jgi:hypothetical protein
MSAITSHATDRALGRLSENGIDGRAVLDRAAKVAKRFPDGSAAVLMARLDSKVGDLSGDFYGRDSNGEDVWAVVRNGRLATLMLRRKEQPATPDALRVDAVYRLKGAMTGA